MGPIGVTGISTDCCVGELTLYNPTECVRLVESGPHHHLIENYLVAVMI